MPYRGRKEEHPLISWFLGSVCMGLLPTVIKFLILKISHSDISPNQFHTELFYLSLVLLADIIKNTSKEYVRWKAAFICTIIYSVIYAYKANMRLKAYLEEQLNPARYEMLLELLWRKKFGKQERLQKILHDLYAQSTVYMTFGKDQRDKMHGWVYSHLTVKDWEKRKPYAVTFKNIAARQHFISYKMLGLTEEPGIFSFKAKNHPYECYREIVVSSTSGAPWMVLIHFPPDEEKAAKPEYYLKMTEEEFEDLTRNGTSTLCLPPARDYRKSD